jgi:hypothetical protein
MAMNLAHTLLASLGKSTSESLFTSCTSGEFCMLELQRHLDMLHYIPPALEGKAMPV